MIPPTKKQRLAFWTMVINGTVASHKRLDKACDEAMKAGALDSNGPLYDAIWRSFETMLDHIDPDKWISWFIYDNGCGKKGLEAKGKSKSPMRKIKTSRQLAQVILESEED